MLAVGAALIIWPAMARANCQWAPYDDCSQLGSGWGMAKDKSDVYAPNFCNYNKASGDKLCCCGPEWIKVGCCEQSIIRGGGPGMHTEYNVFIAAEPKCNTTNMSSFFYPYPLYYIGSSSGEARCVLNEGDCAWISVGTCADVKLVDATKPDVQCAGKRKPTGANGQEAAGLKCCCGKEAAPPATQGNTITQRSRAVNFNYSALTNPLQTVSVPTVVNRIINAFLLIVGSIFLIVIIYGGFMWMTAAGNEARVAKGRNTLVWGVLGVVVIFLAWMLVGFIFEALAV